MHSKAKFFISDQEDDLKYLICKELAKVKKSLYMASFGFSDLDIINHIRLKADLNIPITIHYDQKLPLPLPPHPNIHLIPHTKRGLMHKKILAIDEEFLIFGSTNLTPHSLLVHKNMLVCIRSKELYQAVSSNQILHYDQGGFYPLPENGRTALDFFIKAIDTAEKRIFAAIYTFTHPKILQALIDAKKRGVIVKVFMDRSMAKGVCKKTFALVRSANIPIAVNTLDGLLHHKCALVDNRFFFGSANWTRSAFSKNKEYFLYLNQLDQEQLITLENFFHSLEKSCR